MSKSLKNFITIRQALQEHSPRQLRLMFLLQPWADTINFSDLTVDFARSREKAFQNFFGRVKSALRADWLAEPIGWRNHEEDAALFKEIASCQHKVHAALCNSMDTVAAMNEMDALITYINKYLDSKCGQTPAVLLLKKAAVYISQMLRMFGVIYGSDEIGFPLSDGEAGGAMNVEDVAAPYIEAIIAFRHKVKNVAKDKNASMADILKLCDWVRDEACVDLGVKLEDHASKDETTWKMVDRDELKKEMEEKRLQKEAELRAKKQVWCLVAFCGRGGGGEGCFHVPFVRSLFNIDTLLQFMSAHCCDVAHNLFIFHRARSTKNWKKLKRQRCSTFLLRNS